MPYMKNENGAHVFADDGQIAVMKEAGYTVCDPEPIVEEEPVEDEGSDNISGIVMVNDAGDRAVADSATIQAAIAMGFKPVEGHEAAADTALREETPAVDLEVAVKPETDSTIEAETTEPAVPPEPTVQTENTGPAAPHAAEAEVPPTPEDNELADRIVAAVKNLDIDEDAHWTSDGLPSEEAVSGLLGTPVTRNMIETVLPDYRRTATSSGE